MDQVKVRNFFLKVPAAVLEHQIEHIKESEKDSTQQFTA